MKQKIIIGVLSLLLVFVSVGYVDIHVQHETLKNEHELLELHYGFASEMLDHLTGMPNIDKNQKSI